MSSYDPTTWQIENRGYGFGTGSIVLPNGTSLQVSDLAPELNNVLLREVYAEWMKELG